jgi:O-antigen polymerase
MNTKISDSTVRPALPNTVSLLLLTVLCISLLSVKLFVYPSIAGFIAFTVGSLVLSLALPLIPGTYRDGYTLLSGPAALLCLLIIYVLVNNYFHHQPFHPRQVYLVSAALLVITLVGLFRRFANTGWLWRGLRIIAGIEVLVCLLQFAGILKSVNYYFKVTGTYSNPNVVAMFLAMVLPITLFTAWPRQKKWRVFSEAGLYITTILLLQCRTALVASIATGAFYLLFNEGVKQKWKSVPKSIKGLITGAAVVAIAAGLYLAYNYKQRSADGRWLVWKISTGIIKENPVTGIGYGMFEPRYNLTQAALIAGKQLSPREMNNARYVKMSYNDYLELLMEGGLIGLLLFLLPIIIILRKLYRDIKGGREISPLQRAAYAGVIAYCIMSAVNFCYQAIPVFFVFLLFISVLLSSFSQSTVFRFLPDPKIQKYVAAGAVVGISALLLVVHVRTIKLAFFINKFPAVTAVPSIPAATYLSGIESYWRQQGNRFLIRKEYAKATVCYRQAIRLSADPVLLTNAATCYRQLDSTAIAERLYATAALIYPSRIKYKYDLMNFYAGIGSTEQSKSVAREIIALCANERSIRAIKYKKVALTILSN